jgi:hypothetical protein
MVDFPQPNSTSSGEKGMLPEQLQQYTPAAMAGLVVVGLLFCFFGYRIFRVLLVFAGAIIGAGIAMALANQQWPQSMVATVIAGIGGALAGGIIMIVAYYAGVFLAGALFAMTITAVLTGATTQNPQLVAVIPAAIVGGVLALVLQKLLIILATSFMGSLTTVTGAAYLIWGPAEISKATSSVPSSVPQSLDALLKQGAPVFDNPHLGIAIVWWLVLGAAGVFVQHFWTAKKKHEHAHVPG